MKLRAVLLCALVGCSSGSEEASLSASELAIVDCSRLVVTDVVRLIGGFERVLTGQEALTRVTGETYAFELDLDGTTMLGQVTYPDDPANGIPLGEDVLFTFTLSGPLQGSGSANLNFSDATHATLRGGATLNNDLGCSASLIFLPALPLHVEFGQPIAGPAPAAHIFGTGLWGTIDATITALSTDRFRGDLDIAQGAQDALIDGAINGQAFRHAYSLFPDAMQLRELAACVDAMFELRGELFRILKERTEAIDAAGADLTEQPETAGFTLTPVSDSNATYSIDAALFGSLFTEGTIRGSVRLTRVNLETRAFWSWRIQAKIGEESIVGQSARFYEIAVAQEGGVDSTGEGSLARSSCAGFFDEEGLLTVRGTVGAHTLALDFDGALPVAARIDGIPVPLALAVPG